MIDFVFSTYVSELKKVWHDDISNEDLINLLYNAIILPMNVLDKKGDLYYIDKSAVSKLANRESNVSPKIKKASDDKAVTGNIHQYFSSMVLVGISRGLEAQLIKGLEDLVNGDKSIADVTRNKLLANATEDSLARFLADLFLFAVKIKNKRNKSSVSQGMSGETQDNSSQIKRQSPPLTVLVPPTEVTAEELPYVTALLEAYTDHEKCLPLSIEALEGYTRYKGNFHRQRKNYYTAESVRRAARDIYTEDFPNQFNILEDEIQSGIIEVWEEDHKSGFDRLNKVMGQSATIQLDRCWLARETDWIGVNQRKGVCHVLVNEKKLDGWLKKDE
jgi:hypothetical protein